VLRIRVSLQGRLTLTFTKQVLTSPGSKNCLGRVLVGDIVRSCTQSQVYRPFPYPSLEGFVLDLTQSTSTLSK
jgi:hypothetical protein